MAVNTNYGELAATTLDNYSGKLADNITNHIPILNRLNKRGNVRPASGGKKILQELEYAENSTFQWYSGLESLDVSGSEVFDAAEYEWKQANANVVFSGLDEIRNNGSKEAVHNLLRSRIGNAERTMRNNIASALFANGTGSSGKEIGGLQLLVGDTPSSGTVGNIAASNAFWQNQLYDFSSALSTAGSSTNIQTAMNTLWVNCTRNNDKPDMIVMDNNYWLLYLASLQANQRFTSPKEGQAGFMTLKFMDADVFFDSNCPTNHGYYLNTNFLFLRPHPSRNFTSDRQRMSVNQDAIVIPMFWAGNMTCSNRSLQGVMHE